MADETIPTETPVPTPTAPIQTGSPSPGAPTMRAVADAVAESFNESQGGQQDTAPDGDEPEEEQGEPSKNQEKHKWKTRAGKEVEATLAELKRDYGLRAKSHQVMREAAEERKLATFERAEALKVKESVKLLEQESGQWQTLMGRLADEDEYIEFGKQILKHDVEKRIEAKLIRQIKREMAQANQDPNAIRSLDLEEENERIGKENRRFKTQQERETQARERQQYTEQTQSHQQRIEQEIQDYARTAKFTEPERNKALELMLRVSAGGESMSFAEAMLATSSRQVSGANLQTSKTSAQMLQKPEHPSMASQAAQTRTAQASFRPGANSTPQQSDKTEPQSFNDFFDQFDDRKRRRGS